MNARFCRGGGVDTHITTYMPYTCLSMALRALETLSPYPTSLYARRCTSKHITYSGILHTHIYIPLAIYEIPHHACAIITSHRRNRLKKELPPNPFCKHHNIEWVLSLLRNGMCIWQAGSFVCFPHTTVVYIPYCTLWILSLFTHITTQRSNPPTRYCVRAFITLAYTAITLFNSRLRLSICIR